MMRSAAAAAGMMAACCAGAETLRIAAVVMAEREPDPCFSSGFLEAFALETGLGVETALVRVELEGGGMFEFPFAVASGEGFFELSVRERESLRAWLAGGGFLLASASCSNPAWGASMRAELDGLFEGVALEEIPPTHELFRTLFEIESLTLPGGERAAVYGLSLDGRLAAVFSPDGLNDAVAYSGGCCCCGGGQVVGARFLNANALAYALTR